MVLPGNGAAVDTDVAGLRLQQTIGHAKNGALAAAADADDAVKRAWFHGKGEPVDDIKILTGVLVGNVVEAQNTHVRISQDISQKPSSYRLQLTKTSVRYAICSSVAFAARESINSIKA